MVDMCDTVDAVCPACRASGGDIRYLGDIPPSDRFAGQIVQVIPGGKYWMCKVCKLRFRAPSLSDDQINRLYAEASGNHWNSSYKERVDWRIAQNWICKFIDHGSPKILDIGCYTGHFLKSMPPGFVCHGIEPNTTASEHASEKGVQIVGREWQEISKIPHRYEVITAFDVIEHTRDPLKFLQLASSACAKDGCLIISSGDITHWTAQLLKAKCYYCAIPEHLVFISPEWVNWATSQLGLEVVKERPFAHLSALRVSSLCKQLPSNILYYLMPSLFAFLRKIGVGNIETAGKPEMAHYPPAFSAVRNHFVLMLGK